MKRGHMINRLKKMFPEISGICVSENGSIHLGDCAEGGTIDGISACDYYNEDYNETIYIMNVHKKLVAVLEEGGWYPECVNPGMWEAWEV